MSLTIDDRKFAIALANSGLTIGEAAKRAGMSRPRFHTIINSKKATAQAVGRVAKALGVDVTEIIEDQDVGRAYQIDGRKECYFMARLMYNVKDVQEILGVGESKAYQFIRIMNEELRGKGFLTVQGKVPAAYLQERFFGVAADGKQKRIT